MQENKTILDNQSLELLNGSLSSLSSELYEYIKLRKNAIEINTM